MAPPKPVPDEADRVADRAAERPTDRAADLSGGNTGMASYYRSKHGTTHTATHATLENGTKVRVTNLSNQKSVVVTINGRGPTGDRIIGVSMDAAEELGFVKMGTALVRVDVIAE